MHFRSLLCCVTLAACAQHPASSEPPAPEPTPAAVQPEPLPAPPPPDSPEALARRALTAWGHRDERASLEQAIALWERYLQANPKDPAMLTALARAYSVLGDSLLTTSGSREAALAALEKGVRFGESGLLISAPAFAARVAGGERIEAALPALSASSQAAAYWYGANLTKFALAKGLTTAVFFRERILALLSRVLEIDERYFHAGPHRLLATFYAVAPAAAGGDLAKARAHFERALALEPDFVGTRVSFAEQYAAKAQDRELFVRLLRDAAAVDPARLPELEPEQMLEQGRAQQLLAQVDELF